MRIESLIEALPVSYSQADKELVLRAFKVADRAHEGQKRASGEPYVNHCLAWRQSCGVWSPAEVVAAGLLHDTVEDTSVTLEDLRNDFGMRLPYWLMGN